MTGSLSIPTTPLNPHRFLLISNQLQKSVWRWGMKPPPAQQDVPYSKTMCKVLKRMNKDQTLEVS